MCFSLCPFVARPLLAAHRTSSAGFTPPWFRCSEFEELAAEPVFCGTAFLPTGVLDRNCLRVRRHSPAEVSRCPPDRFASLRFPLQQGGQLCVAALSCSLARRPYARQSTIGPVKSHPPDISFNNGKYC